MKKLLLLACSAALLLSCSNPSTPVTTDTMPPDMGSEVGGDAPVSIVGTDAVLEVEERSPDVMITKDLAPETMVPHCKAGEGCFLDPCDANEQCQSGWCVQHLGEGVCTVACQEECPAGWSCQQVAGASPDVIFICVSDYANLCRPCATNDNCVSVGGAEDVCVDYGPDGNFCGGPCGEGEKCPWGFSCLATVTVDGIGTSQCVADTGECPCTGDSVALALWTPCEVENAFGLCQGKRICAEDGLLECNALTPAIETCNGLDDDCDGEVDEPHLVEGTYVHLCDDDNDCTEDKCLAEEGCANELLESGPCEDGNPCTVADHCVAGTCLGDPVECDDGNPCTDNVCTDTGGCEYPANIGACDDEDPCTVADHCQEGSCSGTALSCECQTDADCAPLEDGDLCNGTLVCDVQAVPYKCVVAEGSEVTCPAPEGEDAFCLQAHCDPATGLCSEIPFHEGLLCDNGDPCTVKSECQDGVCAAGEPINCNDGKPCTEDQCEAGDCLNTPVDGECDDGNACTIGDHCEDGACSFDGILTCNDDNLCTDDSCHPTNGCVHTLNAVPCDDGDSCTTGDHCHLGGCIGGQELACDDGNPCTQDVCADVQGCLHLFSDDPCDDDDPCTTIDKCENGVCTGSGNLDCNDDNICTDDSCVPNSGCANTPNQVACNDGNPCTTADTCAGAACQGGPVANCDDEDMCTTDSCNPESGCVHEPIDPCEAIHKVPSEYATIQEAIDVAKSGETVLVADGTYKGTGNKDLDYYGKAIEVRSENGAEKTIIDCEGAGRGVFFHSSEPNSAILQGFTIRNGFAGQGGAIHCKSSSPTLRQLVIDDNNASSEGGGIYIRENSKPLIEDCTIRNNHSGGSGGGMVFRNGSNIIVRRCHIVGNSVTGSGGAVNGSDSKGLFENCLVVGNTANSMGGFFFHNAQSTISNCTVTNNQGGGLEANNTNSNHVLHNTIFWANGGTELAFSSNAKPYIHTTATYSDIQGGYPGIGNFNVTPGFVDANSNYQLAQGSPCVDSGQTEGAPSDDFGGNQRPQGNSADIGAYESPYTSACTPKCEGLDCGADGCGGVCGTCQQGFACVFGECVDPCIPSTSPDYNGKTGIEVCLEQGKGCTGLSYFSTSYDCSGNPYTGCWGTQPPEACCTKSIKGHGASGGVASGSWHCE